MKKSTSIWILILVMIIWGSSYAVTKDTLNKVPPALLAFIRFLITLAAILPFYLRSGNKVGVFAKEHYLLALMGISGITGYFLLFNYALLYTSAASGALIQGSMPLCIALLGALLLKEKLKKLQVAGIIVSFTGVVMVAWANDGNQNGEKNMLLGNLLMFASVLCWTAYTLISRKIKNIDSLSTTFLSTCWGTLFLLPFAIREYLGASDLSFHAENWTAILYLAIFSSALGNLLYNKALVNLPAATVGNFLNLDILAGVIIAVIFLHEALSIRQVIGGAMILSGLFLSARAQNN